MNSVFITNDGHIISNRNVIEPSTVLMHLGYQVELEQNYTLRSFFRLFKTYDILIQLNAFIPAYLQQVQNAPENGCVYDGFDFLEFSKTVEMIGFPGKPRLEIFHSLKGMVDSEACDIRTVSIDNLLDMPLRLGRLKHIVFGDKVDIFEFDTVYNLFEFIDGIGWELSFQGTLMACELRR